MKVSLRSRVLALFAVFLAGASAAQAPQPVPDAPIIGAKSYLLIDARTGHELAALKPDERLAPASLTKLMTAYVVFDALSEGQIGLEDAVTVSEKAWRTGGSRMFIEVGNQVSVRDLLLGMIVQSGNDASVALAEYVAGTESVFADLMNQYADSLGMSGSHFVNATGLPDDEHYSTARDLATVARAIVNRFPEYYEWYSVREFTWNDITQPNRNRLLWRDDSFDGMKTGRTDDAGYCLVSSATRDDMRVISVVLGTASDSARVDGSQALINYGFRFFETRRLFAAGEAVSEARIWKSANETTPLGLLEDLYVTIPRGSYDSLEMIREVPAVLSAPVSRGQPLAEVRIDLDGETLLTNSLFALEDNPVGSLWQRIRDGVLLWFE
jgi:D-alanyl-D-alanine carboxypeptidase (penicillin-binding protein 5/6)